MAGLRPPRWESGHSVGGPNGRAGYIPVVVLKRKPLVATFTIPAWSCRYKIAVRLAWIGQFSGHKGVSIFDHLEQMLPTMPELLIERMATGAPLIFEA
jgi:hypothetical protein